jgi:glycosyltransferase involved in cell wall biosynthesis
LSSQDRQQLESADVPYTTAENLSEQQMVEEYRHADLVSFTSIYEGFGMPIVEAQWVERPVVTSNVSSMPEVAGDGACLVDPYDVTSIRRGLERVMGDADYRSELIEAGRANRARFSLPTVAGQYLDLYGAIVAGPSVEREAVAR